MKQNNSSFNTLALATSFLVLSACASTGTPPLDEMTTARASITRAESAGALQLTPVELMGARTKLEKAQAASKDERFAEAKRLAEQSAVDADVAERKTRALKSSRAAAELEQANVALEKEATSKARR